MRPPSDGSDALGSCEGAAACRQGGLSLVGRDRRLTRERENSFFFIESSSCRASLFVGQKTEPLGEREQTTQRIVLAQQQTELGSLASEIAEQLEIDARYAGYLERQERDIASFRRDESLLLPSDLDYGAVGSLSREIRDKLATARPATLGAAARVSGVTPAALVALLKHVKKRRAA